MNSFHMSWKYWSVIDYEKTKISDVRCFDWIKLIDWYRLVNIDWLTDIDQLSGLACWPQSVRMKTLWEDLVNKGSNFADFMRFCPHTYTHTQQFLPPLMGDNEILLKEKYLSHYFARLIVFMCAFCHMCLENLLKGPCPLSHRTLTHSTCYHTHMFSFAPFILYFSFTTYFSERCLWPPNKIIIN